MTSAIRTYRRDLLKVTAMLTVATLYVVAALLDGIVFGLAQSFLVFLGVMHIATFISSRGEE